MRKRKTLFFVVILICGALLWLRYPVPYRVPPELPVLSGEEEHRLFVYGTLRSSLLRWLITGQRLDAESASLLNFERQGLDVRARHGAQVSGHVMRLNDAALRRLDRFERLGDRYQRWCIPLADGSRAWVYRRIASTPVERVCGEACQRQACGESQVSR